MNNGVRISTANITISDTKLIQKNTRLVSEFQNPIYVITYTFRTAETDIPKEASRISLKKAL